MAKIDLRDNEFLERFVGPEHVDSNDVQFWYQLLSCSFNFMRVQDPKTVDKTLNPFIDLLALNNNQSLNFGSLIRVAIDRVSRIKSQSGQSSNPYYVYQSFNALYLIRSICKNYIENTSEENLIRSFRAQIDSLPPVPQVQAIPESLPKHLQQSQPQSCPLADKGQQLPNLSNAPSTTSPVNGHPSGQQIERANSESQHEPTSESSNFPQISKDSHQTSAITEEQRKEPEITSGTAMLDQFISTLISIIVDTPLNDSTYLLQVEAINSLIILLSVQMYSESHASKSIIFRSLMSKRCSIHALVLTKTLLNNFVRQDPMPHESGSIIIGLASGLWKVLTLGYGNLEQEDEETMSLLARQSLLLLNVLTNHLTTEKNPYREAIVSCQDSKFNLSDPSIAFDNANNDILATAATSKSILESNSIKIGFDELFSAICEHLDNDQVPILLYLLLHGNKIFKPYVLTTASSNLDKLVLPMLKILYSSIQRGSHQIYMVLIILVILSEEAPFNEAISKHPLHGVPWFKERILTEISLGSFTALILIRSFQYNTFRIRDTFLHPNLYAALSNLSCSFSKLHPYVCQRLVDFLERLTRRYLMSTKSSIQPAVANHIFNQTLEILDPNNPLAKALSTDASRQELKDSSSIELDLTSTPLEKSSNASMAYQNGSVPINITVNSTNNDGASVANSQLDGHNPISQSSLSGTSGQPSPSSNDYASDHISMTIEDSKQDLNLLEEVIRMMLRVVNNGLMVHPQNNSDLIYTLLYKRSMFTSLLSSHHSFYNMVINIERVLTYFYNEIEACQRQLSVDEIKELIEEGCKENSIFDQARDPNSNMVYRYVEDEQPEDFFIPYMWEKIYYSSGIFWNPKRIVLFDPEII